jgi:hypothetical protein
LEFLLLRASTGQLIAINVALMFCFFGLALFHSIATKQEDAWLSMNIVYRAPPLSCAAVDSAASAGGQKSGPGHAADALNFHARACLANEAAANVTEPARAAGRTRTPAALKFALVPRQESTAIPGISEIIRFISLAR